MDAVVPGPGEGESLTIAGNQAVAAFGDGPFDPALPAGLIDRYDIDIDIEE